ncbi:response regulator receiver domain-containing protein [Pseudomonas duriflava]|uniref:Response regulator receiver domain-containing protein n=1 Tax=Pseudomonas duriflava TaxID=459528 RepID=A0A562PYS2_9PSED|nr:response regulator [Pseudomonas duriflava]TWI49320.1 response regulator receiver domain-containing protein [Pseudomonas duriflava]
MSKVSVLIVDDAPFIRDLIKKGLRSQFSGIEMEEAADGRKAQAILSKQSFDLILCDWEMPEMSGLDLLVWCRSQEAHATTPFIMVTSRGDKENVVQAIQAGVSDYIGKPFTSEQLTSKVRKAASRIGKLEMLDPRGYQRGVASFANDSATMLVSAQRTAQTGGTTPDRPAKSKGKATYGQGQLRLASTTMGCVIKALSLKEAVLIVKRGDLLPQVLDNAVLDLEQGEGVQDVARLNGYLHSVAAVEPKPTSDWLQLSFRFVDEDQSKLDYLSRLIAKGTAQKHYVPGA